MKIISHRGFWKESKEKNSEAAFKRSFENGFGLETDIRDYNGDLVVSFRVADKRLSIFSEIFDLLIKSPIGAIKRYRKSGRLSYTRLDLDYHNAIINSGFRIVRKNLVIKDKYNRYEYWELTSD